MTINDFLKRLDESDYDKVMVWSDGFGWANIEMKIEKSTITILPCKNNSPFKDDN